MAGEAIQPITPPESNGWWPYLRGVFKQKLTDTLSEVRGEGTGLDMSASLTVTRRDRPEDTQQRGSINRNLYTQGRRGKMSDIPTPQQLIKQVTGIGDPPLGR